MIYYDIHRCIALIDQNRYIGDDPIGYACTNKATHYCQLPTVKTVGFPAHDRKAEGKVLYLCNTCMQLLRNNSPRITLRLVDEGYFEKIVENLIEKCKNTEIT